jgi:hypothetical protein
MPRRITTHSFNLECALDTPVGSITIERSGIYSFASTVSTILWLSFFGTIQCILATNLRRMHAEAIYPFRYSRQQLVIADIAVVAVEAANVSRSLRASAWSSAIESLSCSKSSDETRSGVGSVTT